MGNQITFDFDEEYLKFGFSSDKKLDDLCIKLSQIFFTFSKFKDHQFIFGKIKLTDIEEIV